MVDSGDDRVVEFAQRHALVAFDRDTDRGDLHAGKGAAAGRGHDVDDLADSVGIGPLAELVDGERGHAPERDRVAVLGQIGERRCLQSGQYERTGPKRPSQRMCSALPHEFGVTCDDPGLRSAEKLVAGEHHEAGPAVEGLAGGGLVGQPAGRTAL